MEMIHSRSYTYIIKNVYPDASEVFDTIIKEPKILERAASVTESYDDFINELAGNWNDLKKTIDEVREGKKYSNAGVVDQKALEDFIRKWRRKQGSTQKGILRDFPEKWPAVHSKSLTAHANLLRLGRMVAKRSVSYQRDLEKELQLQRINPRLNTKDKEDAVLQFFDYGYRYKVSKDSLNRTMDNIYRLVCPEEEEEEAGAAPEEGDTGEGGGN